GSLIVIVARVTGLLILTTTKEGVLWEISQGQLGNPGAWKEDAVDLLDTLPHEDEKLVVKSSFPLLLLQILLEINMVLV
ncbi:hypothetical protein HAX54_031280, partial [Datura stramonium]|nr:hypothetical protein [Datura stramonium]